MRAATKPLGEAAKFAGDHIAETSLIAGTAATIVRATLDSRRPNTDGQTADKTGRQRLLETLRSPQYALSLAKNGLVAAGMTVAAGTAAAPAIAAAATGVLARYRQAVALPPLRRVWWLNTTKKQPQPCRR